MGLPGSDNVHLTSLACTTSSLRLQLESIAHGIATYEGESSLVPAPNTPVFGACLEAGAKLKTCAKAVLRSRKRIF